MIASVLLGYITSALDFFIPSIITFKDLLTDNFDGSFLLLASFIMITKYASIKILQPRSINILENIDIILLNLIMYFVLPISTYLYRNYQAMLEIF